MPHDPLSDVDVDVIVNFDRPSQLTALAVEVQQRRVKDRFVDRAARRAQVLPDRRVDPVVVIDHLADRIERLHRDVSAVRDLHESAARERDHANEVIRQYASTGDRLSERLSELNATVGRLNADLADANVKIDELRQPVPLILHCPLCHTRHVDEGEQATREHRTHACQNPRCGHLWAPAVVATVGVWTLPGCLNVAGTDAYDRGVADALDHLPSTEASAEYQEGYRYGRHQRGTRERRPTDAPLADVIDIARQYVAGTLDAATGMTPRDLALAVVQLADDALAGDSLSAQRAPCPKCKAPGVLLDADGRLAHHAPPGKSDQPLCTHSDPGPLYRRCDTCLARPGAQCSSLLTPVTVGDDGPEFHEGRCWTPLTERECRDLQLSKPRRGKWHRWGDKLKVM